MSDRHNYQTLKEAHSQADHSAPEAKDAAQAEVALTPQEKLEAKYEKLNLELREKHERGRISAAELVHDQRQLDNAHEMELNKLTKSEREAAAAKSGPEPEMTDARQARADRLQAMPQHVQEHSHSSGQNLEIGRERDD